MRTLSCLTVLALVLSACPLPPPDCTGFGSGFAFPSEILLPPFVPSGTSFSFQMVAPGSTCGIANTDVRVTAELFAPSGARIPIKNEDIDFGIASDLQAKATLRITPTEAGDYVVRAIFEPGLGASSLSFTAFQKAAAPLVENMGVEVSKCTSGAMRSLKGAVVCDNSETGDILIFRNGIETQRFMGSELALVGNVMWYQNANALHRRVDTGATFELTHQHAMTRGAHINGEHQLHFALRQTGEFVEKIEALADGGTNRIKGIEWQSSGFVGVDGNNFFAMNLLRSCVSDDAGISCRDNTNNGFGPTGEPIALNPKSIYVSAKDSSQKDGFRLEPRPFRLPPPPTFETPVSNAGRAFPPGHTSVVTPEAHVSGERPLITAANNQIFVWSETNNGLVATQYPVGDFVSVNENFVAIKSLANAKQVLFFTRLK
jgi:hypothetical protein